MGSLISVNRNMGLLLAAWFHPGFLILTETIPSSRNMTSATAVGGAYDFNLINLADLIPDHRFRRELIEAIPEPEGRRDSAAVACWALSASPSTFTVNAHRAAFRWPRRGLKPLSMMWPFRIFETANIVKGCRGMSRYLWGRGYRGWSA